jgi:hypothetical protein
MLLILDYLGNEQIRIFLEISYYIVIWSYSSQQFHTAFMKGMLKIKGKMNLAMKLSAVLDATRKKLPSSKL